MADKRISQLNAHTSPSGSDLLVIVNNNETKKITYADLKDSIVINSDNALLNQFSASYLNDSASFHTRINAATNEQDLSIYVTDVVYEVLSGSVDSRLDNLEGSSGSYETKGRGILSGSISYTSLTNIPSGIISQSTDLSSLNAFTASYFTDSASFSSRIDAATNEQSFNGLISGSSQLTSSYDERYVLSGSITQTTWDNISGKPDGIVSQSVDIADFSFTSNTIQNSTITIVASDGDIVLNADGNVYKGSSNAGNGFVTDGYLGGVIGDTNRVNNSTGNTITDNLDGIINSIPSISSLNTFTSSQEVLNNTFATTGSNTFIGNQTINGALTISTPSAGVPNGVSNWIGGGGWNQGLYSNLATTGGTGTGLTVNVVTEGSGYIDINSITINTPGSGYTNGDVITIDNENNIPGTFTISIAQGSGWTFNTSGSLTTPGDINVSGSIYADNLSGLISSSAQVIDILDSLNAVSHSHSNKTELDTIDQNLSTTSDVQFHNLILDGSASLQSDLTVYGNLKVWGTQSIINSTNVELSDNIIYLSPTASGGDYDLGIVGHYNDGTYQHTGIFSDASDNHAWKVFKGLQSETTGAFIDTNGVGFTLADFKANNIYGGIYATNGVISGSSQLTSSFDSRYTLSGSVQPLPNGVISGSSQLTSSFDSRYLNTYGDNVISGSSQLTSSLDTRYSLSGSSVNINTGSLATTGSNTFIGTEIISGSLLLSGSFSYNGTPLQNGFAFAQPQLTRILDNASYTGSSAWITSYNGNGGAIIVTANVSGYRTTGGLGTAQLLRDGVAVASQTFYFNLANYHTPLPSIVYVRNSETGSHTYSIYFSNILADTNDYATINVLEYGNSAMLPTTIISGSSQLTSSFDTRYAPSASYLTSLNGAFSSSIQTLGGSGVYSSSAQLPSGLISGSSQLTASYDTRYTLSGSIGATPAGTISGSSQLTASFDIRYATSASYLTSLNGAISSSSQLTASYDTRYTLSGSVVSGTTPAGTISGSSQLTSSFDGRYVQTGSFNTLTASFNSFTASAQAVTTGSNSFNGTQTITGSLIITTGSFVGSQILANTSSLYLTSGSNMYVQNNGVVEITGSLKVSGSANFNVSVLSVDGRSGDEGGEINLAIPVTNTTLQNRVTTDVWQNRYRIFEGSANAKGVFVDLSKAPAGVGGELLWKASGVVNTGVDVILGDLKARIPSTGNKSLQLSTTSGVTYSVHGSGVYSQSGTVVGTTLSTALSVTSTPTYIVSGYNFGTAGATDTWVLMDTSNAIAWRITMIIGFAFNNNFISIERLH